MKTSLIGAKAGDEPHLDQEARAWVQVCKWMQQLSSLRPPVGEAMTAGRKLHAEFLERKLRTSGHRQRLGVAAWEEWLCRPNILASSDFDVVLEAIEELTDGLLYTFASPRDRQRYRVSRSGCTCS